MKFGYFVDLNLAIKSLRYLKEIIREYRYVTISDVRDVVETGIKPRNPFDSSRGWRKLALSYVFYDYKMRVWRLRLPEPIYIIVDRNIVLHI